MICAKALGIEDITRRVNEVKVLATYIKEYCPNAIPIVEVTEEDYHACPRQYETFGLCGEFLEGDK